MSCATEEEQGKRAMGSYSLSCGDNSAHYQQIRFSRRKGGERGQVKKSSEDGETEREIEVQREIGRVRE